MRIFEVTTPGTRLDYPDRDWAWSIEGLLCSLRNQFLEAQTAHYLFEKSRAQQPFPIDWEQRHADSNRRSQIRSEVEAEWGLAFSFESADRISHETQVRFKREKWSGGDIPWEFEHRALLIAARTFIYALDGFDKFLTVLVAEPRVPAILSELSDRFKSTFPDLRGVRNTMQHPEDRSRGLDASGKPITLQPVDSRLFNAPGGGMLALDILDGNRFGCTMGDGRFGEVEVSPQSLDKLSAILHEVLDSFQWKGPVQHEPSAGA
jgi:hypothetical protein